MPQHAPIAVHVQPDGLTYALETTDVPGGSTRAIWTFTPPAGSYLMLVVVGGRPSTGTLSYVRSSVAAHQTSDAYRFPLEVDYTVPASGACSVMTGSIPVVLDGSQYVQIDAVTAAGSLTMQGFVLLVPVQSPAGDPFTTGRGVVT